MVAWRADVVAGWSRLPRRDRVAWCLVGLCLLGAVTARPLTRTLLPAAAAQALFAANSPVDPWGRAWWYDQGAVVSTGPDGQLDRRADDPDTDDLAFTPEADPRRVGYWLALGLGYTLRFAGWSFSLLAALLALRVVLPRLRAPRSPRLLPELLHAVVLTGVPAWLLSVLVWPGAWLGLQLPETGLLAVPGPVAVAATLTAFWFLAALGWRLARPPAEKEHPAAQQHSS